MEKPQALRRELSLLKTVLTFLDPDPDQRIQLNPDPIRTRIGNSIGENKRTLISELQENGGRQGRNDQRGE